MIIQFVILKHQKDVKHLLRLGFHGQLFTFSQFSHFLTKSQKRKGLMAERPFTNADNLFQPFFKGRSETLQSHKKALILLWSLTIKALLC